MASRDFRLPPLEGDDVVVHMERDMLQKWGFLNTVQSQAEAHPRDCDTLHHNNNTSVSLPPEGAEEEGGGASGPSGAEDQGEVNTGAEDQNHDGSVSDNDKQIIESCGEIYDDSPNTSVAENDHDEKSVDENECGQQHQNNNDFNRTNKNIVLTDDSEAIADVDISDGVQRNNEVADINTAKAFEGHDEPGNDLPQTNVVEETPTSSTSCQQCMSEEAKVLYDQAYTAYSNKEFCDCLVFVDEALELDDVGYDVELWLLRAKVMNSMEDHREALRSAYKVKGGDRPSRLWVEGALALEKLGLLATAENWVARAMQICHSNNPRQEGGSDVMDILEMMRSRLRIERVFGPLVKDKPVRVMASYKYNRIVSATRKIQKSEIIFRELPELVEQSIKSHRLTACAHCAKSLVQPQDVFNKEKTPNNDMKKAMKRLWPKVVVVGCKSCKEVKYCSEECRCLNWESCHVVMCPSNPESTASMLYDVRRSFRDVIAADGSSWQGWWNAEFSPTFLARIWSTVMCRAKRLADLKDKESYRDSDWLMAESSLEKYASSKKFQTSSESIPKMHELLGSLFKRSKFMHFPITEEEFNKRYSQLACNIIPFHDPANPAAVFFEEVRKDKKLKKKCPSDTTQVPVTEFHGLFPLICCFNHSCFPNAQITSDHVEGKPGLSVRATQDIKPGEEIVVSYINPHLERFERRSQLWKKYKFICQCLKCIHEGSGPDQCTNCGKSSKGQGQNQSRSSSGHDNNINKNMDAIETDAVKQNHDAQKEEEAEIIKKADDIADHCENRPDNEKQTTLEVEDNRTSADDTYVGNTNVSVSAREDVTSIDDCPPSGNKHADILTPGASEAMGQGQVDEANRNPKAEIKLFVCGRCKRAWYCSARCQKEAWLSGHKKICVPR